MKLIQFIKRFLPRSKLEVIRCQYFGKTIIEVKDINSIIVNSEKIFINVLKSFPLEGIICIYINQYIDETQGHKGFRSSELVSNLRENGVEPFFSVSFTDSTIPTEEEYVIQVEVRNDLSLGMDILCFGMTSIPNIMYFTSKSVPQWRKMINEWNEQVLKWYWLEGEKDDLIHIAKQVEVIVWTSDGHLNLLVTNELGNEIIRRIGVICKEYDFLLSLTDELLY